MRPEVQVLPGPHTIEASGRELARVFAPIELLNIRRFVESSGRSTASQTYVERRWPVLKSVVLVALAAGAFVVVRKRRSAQADAALWREATSTR
jgi:hypothetical protein